MPHDRKARQNQNRRRALHADALKRIELGQPTTLRESAVGITSMAIKACDSDLDRMIAEFERKRLPMPPRIV